jgi:hypothetical protein
MITQILDKILTSKLCGKCKQEKSISEFWRDNNPFCKTGFRSFCKACSRASVRKWRQTTKGRLSDRFYQIRRRCTNPAYPRYRDYGGRGIECKFKSRKEFIDYMLSILPDIKINNNITIDRIDNNGHYEPGNLRFATQKQNINNRERDENDRRFRRGNYKKL